MKFWQAVSFTEIDQLVEVAKLVEQTGFDGILVSDHLFFPEKLGSKYPYTPDGVPGFTPDTPWPEPFAAVAAMAAVTKRLRFATMVYILPLRNPVEVAKATATLDVLTGGRFILGSGAGWMKEEFDQLGVEFKTRGARFDESIEVLRTLWRGGMDEHRGRFFDVAAHAAEPRAREARPDLRRRREPGRLPPRRAAGRRLARRRQRPGRSLAPPGRARRAAPRGGPRAAALRGDRPAHHSARRGRAAPARGPGRARHGQLPVPVRARPDLEPRPEARLPGGLRRERDPQVR